MLSSEFLDRIEKGQKDFRAIELQYADLSGRRFENIAFTDCTFTFVLTRDCTFENVTFTNCSFFFQGFGRSTLRNVTFAKCRIDYSGFTDAIFEGSRMIDTSLTWSVLIGAHTGGLTMERCTEFKVVRQAADITPADVTQALAGLQPMLNQLDFDTREKMMRVLETAAKRYEVELPKGGAAGTIEAIYRGREGIMAAYTNMLDEAVNHAIGLYGEKPYRPKGGAYEKKPDKKYR